jgi:hypothetical protein
MDDASAFFVDEGRGRFSATALTRGPWSPDAQHAGPPAALLGRCMEALVAPAAGHLARCTVEILRPVPIGVLEVATTVVRPGRSIALLAATAHSGGREILRASAWWLRTDDVGMAVAPAPPPEHPPPEALPPGEYFDGAPDIGYHSAMELRFAVGGFNTPGPAVAWMRMAVPLLGDEEPSPLVRVLAAADSGNGISSTADPRRVLFVNTDLTVALHRPLVGEWVQLDARTVIEPHGIGLATAVLRDRDGDIGLATQTLFVTRR